MRLYAQLPENRQGLTTWLSEIGYQAEEMHDGGVLVMLPLAAQELTRYLLPPVADAFHFVIRCHEYGPRYWGPGTASVVCGPGGFPLRPRRVPRNPFKCAFDARFLVPHDVVTVRVNVRTNSVIIRQCQADREGQHGLIVCRTVYQGDHRQGPPTFHQAVLAARHKAARPAVHAPVFVARGR